MNTIQLIESAAAVLGNVLVVAVALRVTVQGFIYVSSSCGLSSPRKEH
jgi:hypothetical protein